jgi:hypothetical protein
MMIDDAVFQCCESGSKLAWIRIDPGLLDPDPDTGGQK